LTYPLKIRQSENRSCAMFPPVSACSMPAMIMELKVDANNMKIKISRNMVPPRSVTLFVGYPLRKSPIG
jgi:hypothetical protein